MDCVALQRWTLPSSMTHPCKCCHSAEVCMHIVCRRHLRHGDQKPCLHGAYSFYLKAIEIGHGFKTIRPLGEFTSYRSDGAADALASRLLGELLVMMMPLRTARQRVPWTKGRLVMPLSRGFAANIRLTSATALRSACYRTLTYIDCISACIDRNCNMTMNMRC